MGNSESTDMAIELALETTRINKQALIFANTRRSAEKTAEELAKKLKDNPELEEIENDILHALSSPTKQCKRLAFCVKKGIAFHHSGLAPKQRELIEDSFREGKIKVICSTPTLAYGLDLPAFRVILQDLRRYSSRGLRYIPVLEYMQMSGRAGRPKFDSCGESVAISNSDKSKIEIESIYLNGEPEDIYSKLAAEPALRTYVLSLVATNFADSKKELFDFFSRTFWAHHYNDTYEICVIITKMLDMLEMWDFINIEGDADFDEDVKIKATPLGNRVAQLYIDPLTANDLVNGLRKADKNTKDFAFLQLLSNTLEARPLLRAKKSDEELIDSVLSKYENEMLQEFTDYEYSDERQDYLNSIKTGLFYFNWINESNEDTLFEKFDIKPGEISAKLSTAEWLIYAMVEIAKILGLKDITPSLMKLNERLRYGAKEELLPLLKLKNIGKIRARKLFDNGIKDMGDLKKADFGSVAQLIGNNIAIDVKKQVGQDFSNQKIKESKRKGQMSLAKYSKNEKNND